MRIQSAPLLVQSRMKKKRLLCQNLPSTQSSLTTALPHSFLVLTDTRVFPAIMS